MENQLTGLTTLTGDYYSVLHMETKWGLGVKVVKPVKILVLTFNIIKFKGFPLEMKVKKQ